jgi:hypothetical protein
MSVAAPPAVPTTGIHPPAAMPRRSNPRRRSPALASLGVVLVVIGALAGWRYVAAASSDSRPYIAVYQQVSVGEQITSADLQVVSITSVRGLTPIPASQMSSIVGQFAKVALVPGTLLTAGDVTTTNAVGPNQALIGLKLGATQRPGRGLRAGDHVLLVSVPQSAGSSQAGAPSLPLLPAIVIDVNAPDTQNTAVVDVLVPVAEATAVAALANLSEISVVLVAAGS